MEKHTFSINRYVTAAFLGVFLLVGLYLTSIHNYLLFHSLVELFGVIVACSIFILAWNTRRIIDNHYLLFIGIAYLFVAAIGLVHSLAYKGMGVFTGFDANLSTQLWIMARYMESVSLFIAPFFIQRRLKLWPVFTVYAMVSTLLLLTVFQWNNFPACYVEGQGLTTFKIVSEYVISLILLGALFLLFINRKFFDRKVLGLLLASVILTICSELAFTAYVSVYGFANMLGHIFMFLSFCFIYEAIVLTGLQKPYSLLFRDLKQREEQILDLNTQLEDKVRERTMQLQNSNESLKASLREKEILLREVHHRVKNNMQVMSGLLDLQATSTVNPELINMVNESQSRIRAMALVHEKLYASNNLARIDLAGYVRSLSQELFQSYSIDSGKIDLIIEIDGVVFLDISKAIPCGLILNELISNALRNAFPGDGPGEIKITIHETENVEIEIVVRDNGLGLPDDVDIHQPRSVGLHLVNGLIKNQLDGQINVTRDAGTEFRIKFPL